MADPFAAYKGGVFESALRHAVVTPDDNADLPVVPRGLRIGTGGDLRMRDADGTDLTWTNVASGSVLAFRARRVLATGTTASDILALW
jgi:hypothetical protein